MTGAPGRVADDTDGGAGPMLAAGKMVGRYRLLSLVASGGMAQIWAAKPESGGFSRTVALKVVRPEYADDDEYRRMLIDEAAAASAVHHPNVCEIFELGQHQHVVFIAMEWVPGDSIAGLIRQRTQYVPFSYALAARVIADACAGLHAAHNATGPEGEPMHIVHRDISPQNILLSSQGHVKVTDFGIAKARDQIHSRTRTGEIKGKFAYISPEQILGKGVDLRSDVYAMGCVLYVTTLGLRPFGRGTHAVMSKIVQGDFKAPRALVPTYPEKLERIVVRALSRKPEDRYGSAEEMRLALEDWLAKSNKIITHTDIARAVNERLNPKVRDQIQALRNANRFSPQTAVAPRELENEEEPEDSWELPTAVSGLIQLPEDIAREAAPSPHRDQATVPVPSAAGVARAQTQSANDTQPSIAPEPEHTGGAREATRRSNDHKLPQVEKTPSRPEPTPVATSSLRGSDGAPSASTGREERKRQILLALAVVVLVVLSFLAGRL
ncbi:MAG: serine/threonine-protein kinase [Deltaproteobacteria bacterium]